MPRYIPAVEEEEAPGSTPRKRRRRWFASETAERIVLIASILVVATAIKIAFSLAGSRVKVGRSQHLPALTLFWRELASEVEPEQYNPLIELRVPLAERTAGGLLKPFVMVLKGPWTFGVAQIDSVALALGKPTGRGAGYLIYDLEEGRIRLTVLFNAGRLDTLAVAPKPCPPDTSNCDHPYVWGLTKKQKESEELRYEPPAGPHAAQDQPCGTLEAPSRGLYYTACPVLGDRDDPSVPAVYIQRVTAEVRNPPAVRGLAAPGGPHSETEQKGLAEADYQRLLYVYQESLRIKQKALGPEHASVPFLRFEIGRMQVEAGKAAAGSRQMRAALDKLSHALASNHPDLAAMRLWVVSSVPRR